MAHAKTTKHADTHFDEVAASEAATTPIPAPEPVRGTLPKFSTSRKLTYELLKKKDFETCYVKITSEIFTGKAIAGVPGQQKMEPARLCRVVDLTTGEEKEMICNKVLESALTENYEGSSYVGLCFSIRQYPITGRRYKGYELTEITVES